jgi:FKBP-type peptidyl-prolyl cis-trans isomerase SlyD
MMDQNGNKLNGVVLELSENEVKMDFNHPLAGENLHFKGQVEEIRPATEEELSHEHIHSNK